MTFGGDEEQWGGDGTECEYDASAEYSGGGNDKACRSCGQEGHFARDCPDKKPDTCFNCGEEGHRKTDCPNPRSGGGACRKCNEEGHMARDCPNAPPMVCRKCSEEGHMSRECPNAPPITCRHCGEEGHVRRDCPSAPPMTCRKCNEEGHMSRDCPNAPPDKCYNCGEEGHRADGCENERVVRRGEDGEALPPPVTYIPQLDDVTDASFDMLNHSEANISRYDTMAVTVSDPHFEVPINSFAEAGFSENLMEKIVTKLKFTAPTPIQKFCIPIIAAGRDVIACSQTGSGKSAAFILPILQNIMNDPELPDRETALRGQRTQSPLVVVLSPTRELCIQLYEHFRLFSEELPRRIGVSPAYGGTQVRHNAEQIRAGTHVLCAVPGRLKQFVEDKTISFAKVKFLVLDEADRMLDDGFQESIKAFAEHESMVPKENRQTLMFSATFSKVEGLARQMMKPDAVKVVVGILGGVNADVAQTFVETSDIKAKREALKLILEEIPGAKIEEADNLQPGAAGKVMVFVEKKKSADVLGVFLNSSGFSATTMHGNRDQQQREEALRTFRTGKHAVLVATEVAARGLDIKGLGMVVNFDLPQDIDKYVHRVGRTGRVGIAGKAVSFFDPAQDGQLAPQLVKVLNECEQPVPDYISEAAAGDECGDGDGDGEEWGNDNEESAWGQ